RDSRIPRWQAPRQRGTTTGITRWTSPTSHVTAAARFGIGIPSRAREQAVCGRLHSLIQRLENPPDFLGSRGCGVERQELLVVLLRLRAAAHLHIGIGNVLVRFFAPGVGCEGLF